MSDLLRLGLIGAGGNTREKHIPGFQALPDVKIVAVANRTEISARAVAESFGIPRVAKDWREIVDDPEVDAVCIGTWPYLHAEVTCAALAAGKHVLTEARMARDAAEAEAMLAASRQHPDLVAQVVPSPFTLPVDDAVRRLLDDDEIGALREVSVTHTSGAYADAASALTWRQDRRLSGLNTLTLGIYYEPLLRWIDGDARVVAADAEVFTRRRRNAAGEEVEVEIPESLTVLGRFGAHTRLVMHFSGVERGLPRNEIRLNGEKGSLRLNLASGDLWVATLAEGERRVEIAPEQRGKWQVEEDFVASIREGRPVRRTDFATGVRTMRFTEAVWRAWAGQPPA